MDGDIPTTFRMIFRMYCTKPATWGSMDLRSFNFWYKAASWLSSVSARNTNVPSLYSVQVTLQLVELDG